jgi:hypothetical protein
MDIQYARFLKNKRIVLVGPSPSLLDRVDGKLIDSYDIVIRIKKGYPIPKRLVSHLGRRTDILCTHLKTEQNNFKHKDLLKMQQNIKWLSMPYPLIKPFNKFYDNFIIYYKQFLGYYKLKQKPIHYVHEMHQYNRDVYKMDTTPTTASAFILDLLRYDFKELYITGITFRQDGYYNEYKTKKQDSESYHRTVVHRKVHNYDKETVYMINIIMNDKRITYDEPLTLIIQHNMPFEPRLFCTQFVNNIINSCIENIITK